VGNRVYVWDDCIIVTGWDGVGGLTFDAEELNCPFREAVSCLVKAERRKPKLFRRAALAFRNRLQGGDPEAVAFVARMERRWKRRMSPAELGVEWALMHARLVGPEAIERKILKPEMFLPSMPDRAPRAASPTVRAKIPAKNPRLANMRQARSIVRRPVLRTRRTEAPGSSPAKGPGGDDPGGGGGDPDQPSDPAARCLTGRRSACNPTPRVLPSARRYPGFPDRTQDPASIPERPGASSGAPIRRARPRPVAEGPVPCALQEVRVHAR